jgi:hypothetical protein
MAIVISLCVGYALYCFSVQPAGPITSPDSALYLAFSPIVPLGYPTSLSIVGPRGAVVLQPIFYSASLALLGREVLRATGVVWLAAAVITACMAAPQLAGFHSTILTESLFLSAIVTLLALAIRFAHHPSWRLMVLAATTAGISVTIRRTGLALLPVLLIMALLALRRQKTSHPVLLFVAAVAPFMAVVAIEQAIAPIVHAGQASSLMGRHLFAKAALIDAPPAPPTSDPLRTALDEHLETRYAPIRQLLARAPHDVRAVLALYYETCLQGACVEASRGLMTGWGESLQTTKLGDAGLARIARAPLGFIGLTALHFRSLWTVDRLRNPDLAVGLGTFVEANRPLPFEHEVLGLEAGQPMALPGLELVRYLQLAITAMAFFTAVLAVIGLVSACGGLQLPPALAAATLAALIANGGLLFTALLAAGFSRFTLGLWPAITTATILGLYCAVRLGRPLRSTNF